ncbi:MAG: DUF3592 domain-containing protein [Gemmatimonadota bacterium]|nr:DUF3592 domain-containing protein [Gemmatimonadota bacterium]MDH5198196.1 DUF3592 domain-containing protein [Gemmatimonadota bacterium]
MQRIIGVVFAAFGLVALVGSWGAYRYDTRIVREGAQATAEVTDRDVVSSADGGSDFDLDYTFILPDGRRQSTSRSVPKSIWDTIAVGQSITVFYDPANPGRNFPVGAGNTSLGLTIFLSAFGVVFLLVGAVLVAGTWRAPPA